MKSLTRKFPLLLLMLSVAFTACNDDDPEVVPANPGNTNSNATRIFSSVTENAATTNARQVANRLEIPQLRGNATDLFIVHTVPNYGINYCMEYDCNLKAQRWSAYQSYASNNVKKWNRSDWRNTEWGGDPFQEDPLIPTQYRTTLADHRSNGHDRGHIMGSEDRVNSKDANEQTFYLSNMHPQLTGFNSRKSSNYGYSIWYNLENRIRDSYRGHIYPKYKREDGTEIPYFCDTLYVVKGGTIDEGNYTWVRGAGQYLVCPNYFFMALLRKSSKDKTQNGYAAIGFWMEHKENTTSVSDTNFAKYAVSIDRLEELTGIDFFCNLPDDIEKQVESNLVLSTWKLR